MSRRKANFVKWETPEQVEALIEDVDRVLADDPPPYVRLAALQLKRTLVLDLAKVRPVKEAEGDPIEAIRLRSVKG